MDQASFEYKQKLPTPIKIMYSKLRIREWIDEWGLNFVHLNYSGGRDSDVLKKLIEEVQDEYFPGTLPIKKVFSNTGLENPHNLRHVRSQRKVIAPGVIEVIRPKYKYPEIVMKYGFPAISKQVAGSIYRYKLNPEKNQWRLNKQKAAGYIPKIWRFLLAPDAPLIGDYCCTHLKELPLKRWAKKHNSHPFIGIRASESNRRKNEYLKHGCNAFDKKEPQSWPIAFWTDVDIQSFIEDRGIQISRAYETEQRTGCMFCLFGIKYDHDRFVRMKRDHPKYYKYCMEKLGLKKILSLIEKGLGLLPGRLIGERRLYTGSCPKCRKSWETYISDGAADSCPHCGNKEVE